MDQSKYCSTINQYYFHSPLLLIIHKTILKFLLPTISLLFFLSFILASSYTTTTSSIFSTDENSSGVFGFFPPLLFPLSTLTFQRKYIFLVCNVILAFLTGKFSSYAKLDDFADKYPQHANVLVADDELLGLMNKVPQLQLEQCIGDGGVLSPQENEFLKVEDKDGLDLVKECEDEERDYEEIDTRGTCVGEEENLDTDELNKKFEEFIRKMKKEIRIEAQQQLIAV